MFGLKKERKRLLSTRAQPLKFLVVIYRAIFENAVLLIGQPFDLSIVQCFGFTLIAQGLK